MGTKEITWNGKTFKCKNNVVVSVVKKIARERYNLLGGSLEEDGVVVDDDDLEIGRLTGNLAFVEAVLVNRTIPYDIPTSMGRNN